MKNKYMSVVVMTTMLVFFACNDDSSSDPNPGDNRSSPSYSTIATDKSGDANNGLDGTKVEYKYDPQSDSLFFRISVTDLESFASSPSVDLSFQLPNGTNPASTAATPFRGETKTHRTVSVYTDMNGSWPDSYTFMFGTYAANGVCFTSEVKSSSSGKDLESICADCIDLYVDVPNKQIILSMDRKKIISDVEIGSSKKAQLKLVANTGYQMANNDLVVDGAEFSIEIK